MVFNTITLLCNHHNCLIPKHFHYLTRNLMPISSHSPFLCPCSPGTHQPAFCPCGFACLNISYSHHTVCVWLLSRSVTFGGYQRRSFSLRLSDTPWMAFPHCVYASPACGHLGCCHLLAVVSSAAVNAAGLSSLWCVVIVFSDCFLM